MNFCRRERATDPSRDFVLLPTDNRVSPLILPDGNAGLAKRVDRKSKRRTERSVAIVTIFGRIYWAVGMRFFNKSKLLDVSISVVIEPCN